MPYRNLMKNQYNEINNLTNLLSSMVNSYRLLIGGANELNNIYEAKKGNVKDAVKRADDLGEIIDEIIKTIDECSTSYIKYCKIKKSFIDEFSDKDSILTEIDYELDFKNSTKRDEDEDEDD